jgi:hypothetical protein
MAAGQQAHLDSAGQCYPSSLTSRISDKVVRSETRIAEYSWGSLDWDFELYCQPPNSPDMNMNNLCFFASLQSIQYHNPTDSLHKMIQWLRLIYEEYPQGKLNNSFLTLQTCMNQVIKCHGGIDYKIEHMNKARLERLGLLAQSIWVMDAAMAWNCNNDGPENLDNDEESGVV